MKNSGNLKREHLNSGRSHLNNTILLGCYSNGLLFKWRSDYRSIKQLVIWILNYHGARHLNIKPFDDKKISVIWITTSWLSVQWGYKYQTFKLRNQFGIWLVETCLVHKWSCIWMVQPTEYQSSYQMVVSPDHFICK